MEMEIPFERDAMIGKPTPLNLDVADTCLYVALKYLYTAYRRGLISREQGAEEKKRLVFNWAEDKSKVQFLDRQSQALKDKIGAAADRYKSEPTIENADKLYAAFYNLPDDWRQNKNEAKQDESVP